MPAATAWKPADLASALTYKTPDYSNIFNTPVGQNPGTHSAQDYSAAQLGIAQSTDAANNAAYNGWMAQYNTEKAQRDVADKAAADAYGVRVNTFNNAAPRTGSTTPWVNDSETSYPPDPKASFSGKAVSFMDQEGNLHGKEDAFFRNNDGSPSTYTPPDYKMPTYTDWSMPAPANYTGLVQQQAAQTATAQNATFGGRVTPTGDASLGTNIFNPRPDAPSGDMPMLTQQMPQTQMPSWLPHGSTQSQAWAPPAQAQTVKLGGASVVGNQAQTPNYIGNSMPQLPQGGPLNANRVKPPGT